MFKKIKIAWFGKHFGEEPPLVGNASQGSGAIFFSGCNLRCVFCQNHQISQGNLGQFCSVEDLAEIMLQLQSQGAININLVTPTIWWQWIKPAIRVAKANGLKIPIIWNSNAYESIEIIQNLSGLVDVYLPDFKYADDTLAFKYSKVKNYSTIALGAIRAMLDQVGRLQLNSIGLAERGILIRHLILPGQLNNSFGVLNQLNSLDPNIYISLMSQYQPLYHAVAYPELNRSVTQAEFEQVFNHLTQNNFVNGFTQEPAAHSSFVPDFTHSQPFETTIDKTIEQFNNLAI
jgi:putative pyruvate formate lyase activating enzyme